MYRIAVLINSEAQEAFFTEQISQFCAECERFPVIETFRDQEQFFETTRKTPPTNAVIALPGVDGLNAVEHLRALSPIRALSGAAIWIFRFMLSDCVQIIFCWSR